MQRRTRSELQMLREIVWLLVGKHRLPCFFCQLALLELPPRTPFGRGYHSAITTKMCVHHIDEERLALAHSSCHRSFHMKQRREDEQQTSDSGDVS
jgi:hypothetical protein